MKWNLATWHLSVWTLHPSSLLTDGEKAWKPRKKLFISFLSGSCCPVYKCTCVKHICECKPAFVECILLPAHMSYLPTIPSNIIGHIGGENKEDRRVFKTHTGLMFIRHACPSSVQTLFLFFGILKFYNVIKFLLIHFFLLDWLCACLIISVLFTQVCLQKVSCWDS